MSDLGIEPRTGADPAPVRRHRAREPRRSLLAAVLVGVIAAAVSFAGAWSTPSALDEAATMSAANRSLAQLWQMAQHVDGVHSLYYALVHVWLDVVPFEFWTLRLPGAVGIGIAAGLLVELARRMVDLRTGIVAGLVFAVLPRVTSAGVQGRSYALTTTTAAALTLVLVVAVDRSLARRRSAWVWWAAYVVVGVLGTYLFLYSALLLVAHALAVAVWLLVRRRRSDWTAVALPFAAATAVVAAATVPLALLTSGQASEQLYWMSSRLALDGRLADSVFVQQYFARSLPLALVGWALALLGVVAAFVDRRLRSRRPAAWLALCAVVVPTVAVIVVSVVVQPYYNSRYLTFAAPFVALLVALGATSFRARLVAPLAVLVVVALATPAIVAQRAGEGSPGGEWERVAAAVAADRAAHDDAAGTDAVYYGPLPGHPKRTTEYVSSSYPAAFADMRDLTVVRSAASIGQLWADRLAPGDDLPLDGVGRVWYVGGRTSVQPAAAREALARAGFSEDDRQRIGDFYVITFTR